MVCEGIPRHCSGRAHVHVCTRIAQPNLPEENPHASTSAGPAGAGGLRGIASTGSIWPHHQHQASLGSSPVGAAVWPGGMVGHGSHGNLQDLLQKQALSAALQQQAAVNAALGLQGGLQQPNALVQNAALQAAVQQALLTQQAAALLGAGGLGGAGLLGPGGRRPPEAPLGGRLARRPMDPVAEAERRMQQVCRGWMAGREYICVCAARERAAAVRAAQKPWPARPAGARTPAVPLAGQHHRPTCTGPPPACRRRSCTRWTWARSATARTGARR